MRFLAESRRELDLLERIWGSSDRARRIWRRSFRVSRCVLFGTVRAEAPEPQFLDLRLELELTVCGAKQTPYSRYANGEINS